MIWDHSFTSLGQRLCVLVSLWFIVFLFTLKIIVKISAFPSVRCPFSVRRLLRQRCVSAKWPWDHQSYFCGHFLLAGFLSTCPPALSENQPAWWTGLPCCLVCTVIVPKLLAPLCNKFKSCIYENNYKPYSWIFGEISLERMNCRIEHCAFSCDVLQALKHLYKLLFS